MIKERWSFILLKSQLLIAGICLAFAACKPSGKLSQEGVRYSAEAISELAAMLDTSAVFSANFTGFALYDPASRNILYGQNEHRYFTPASNTKLFTFYTGLKLLPSRLLALRYVSRGDSLIFWGTGDPSFLHREIDNGAVYAFLKDRSQQLYFSDANFDDELLGPGWSWSDYQYSYQTEKSPLPVYGNTVRFEKGEVKGEGSSRGLDKRTISPPFFIPFVDTVSSDEENQPLVSRSIDGNQFTYHSKKEADSFQVDKPYHYTPQVITNLLADTLDTKVKYIDAPLPDSADVLYSILSDTAYKRMLQPSDNFIAEQLLLVTAAHLKMDLNSKAVIDTMKANHLDFLPQEPQWVDGSGLSRYNLFTPATMVRLLEAIDEEFSSDQKLFELFPAGGESGTIEHWYAARDGGPPYVFAKTGTLSNNHTLSGYLITRSGHKLIFSFMNNHYVTSSSVIKEEMEKVLWYIHTHF